MEENRKLAIAALVVLLGGNAGAIINGVSPAGRHDPFTGTEGERLEDRIELLELEVSGCKRDNAVHREDQAAEVSTIKARTLSNKYLIERCMSITGG